MVPTTECPEQKLLRERYAAATQAYREMILALEQASTPKEFTEMYERAEGVRLVFVRARLDVENHIREHGCRAFVEMEAVAAS